MAFLGVSGRILSICLPVNYAGGFVGAVCTDMQVSNLLADITYLGESETSYAFMTDKYGQTLVHPLLPVNRKTMPDVINIQYFEKSTGIEEVITSMKRYFQMKFKL